MSHIFLIYISREKDHLTEEQVEEIAHVSVDFNRTHHITGLLLHIGNYFVQVLEGENLAVTSLLEKISLDARHENLRTIFTSHRVKRLFPKWNMGYFNLESHYTVNRLDAEALKRYVAQAFANGGSSAESLVQVIRALPALLETSTAGASSSSQ